MARLAVCQPPADWAGKQNLTFSKPVAEPTKTTKEVLWKTKKKKRKSLESISRVVMVENKKNMAENWCGSSSE